MSGHTAQRTLVKSPPELWAELSDAASLAKHLGEFGEIRITRAEPESLVAWEGERANGTVSLEPAGWGTRVTLTATAVADERAASDEAIEAEPSDEAAVAASQAWAVEDGCEPSSTAQAREVIAPEPETTPAPAAKRSRFGRFKRWLAASRDTTAWRLSDDLQAPAAPHTPADEGQRADADEDPVPAAPIRLRPPPPPAEPEPEPEPPAAAEASPLDEGEIATLLSDVLDTLGAAHHRPFSRG
jgi:hypothetical protein